MGKGYKHGGSGGKKSSINFDIKAYPSEVELRADTPAENTIGIVTTTTITGWEFSSTEPTEPKTGMIWISTGTKSGVEFNALTENAVKVYPLTAKQYVEGAFAEVTAKSYQDEKWVDWLLYLYDQGDEFDTLTGGWSKDGYAMGASGSLAVGTKNTDNFTLTGDTSTFCILGTAKAINVDNFKTLHIDGEPTGINSNNRSIAVGINSEKKFVSHSDFLAHTQFPASKSRTTVELDISSISGDVYVVAYAWNSASCHGKVYGIWMT